MVYAFKFEIIIIQQYHKKKATHTFTQFGIYVFILKINGKLGTSSNAANTLTPTNTAIY